MPRLIILAVLILTVVNTGPAAHADEHIPAGAALSVTLGWQTDHIKRGGPKSSYDIDVKFPKFVNKAGQPLTSLNDMVRKVVLPVVQENEAEFKENQPPRPEMRSHLAGDYKGCLLTDALASLQFTFEAYTGGAAHPWHWTQVLNCRITPPEKITLKSMFKPGSGYLQKISDICVAGLQKTVDKSATNPEVIKEGAAPNAEKLKNFCLHKDSISLTFDEGEVAARYIGPQSVTVPYSKIKNMLNPKSPVYALASL